MGFHRAIASVRGSDVDEQGGLGIASSGRCPRRFSDKVGVPYPCGSKPEVLVLHNKRPVYLWQMSAGPVEVLHL